MLFFPMLNTWQALFCYLHMNVSSSLAFYWNSVGRISAQLDYTNTLRLKRTKELHEETCDDVVRPISTCTCLCVFLLILGQPACLLARTQWSDTGSRPSVLPSHSSSSSALSSLSRPRRPESERREATRRTRARSSAARRTHSPRCTTP